MKNDLKAYYYASILIRACTTYFLIFIISNNFLLEQTGDYFYYLAIANFISMSLPLGLNATLERTSYNKNKAKYLFNISLSVVIVLSGFFYIINEKISYLPSFVSVFVIVKAVELVFESYLVTTFRYKILFAFWLAMFGINCFLFLVIYGNDVKLIIFEVFGFIAILEAFVLVLFLFYSRSLIAIRISFIWSNLNCFKLNYSISLLLVSLMNLFLNIGDRLLLGMLGTKSDLAIYSLVYTVAFASHRFFSTPFTQISGQVFFRDKDFHKFKMRSAYGLLLLLVLCIFNALAFSFYYSFIGLSYPPIWLLLLLSLGVCFAFCYFVNLTALKYTYNSRYMLFIKTALLLFNLLSNYFFIPIYGMYAAAVITMCTYLLGFILSYNYSFHNNKNGIN